MMSDKRDECGCHRKCLLMVPHACPNPCIWPACLTDDEATELLAQILAEESPDA